MMHKAKRFLSIFALIAAPFAGAQQAPTAAPQPSSPVNAADSSKSVESPLKETDKEAPPATSKVGVDISPPKLISAPEAEFSDEARRKKKEGTCLVSVIVDSFGMPQNPRIVQAAGYGLDEQALAAIRQYRFEPARRKDGAPVAVLINIQVDFHLYKNKRHFF